MLGWLVATEDLSRIGLLLAGVIGAIGLVAIVHSRFPLGALGVLVASAAMPRFAGTLLGLHVRAEHVAIGLVVLMVAVEVSRRRLQPRFELKTFDYFLIAYIALNFLTSAVTSPEPRMTLRWAALSALAMIPYFLMRILVRNEGTLYKALHVMLWAGLAEAVYGILTFLSHLAFGTTLGIELEQYGFTSGTYGTQYETNLFGSYTACCAIMFLALFVLSDRPGRRWYGWGFAITLVAAIVSLTRSVLAALPVESAPVCCFYYSAPWSSTWSGNGSAQLILAIYRPTIRPGSGWCKWQSRLRTYRPIRCSGPGRRASTFSSIRMIFRKVSPEMWTSQVGSAIRPFAFCTIPE